MKMRVVYPVLAVWILSTAQAFPHGKEEAPPADSSGAKAGAAEEKDSSGKGPLERAGAELDKALGKTAEAINNAALEFRVKNHLHNHNGLPWRELVVTANKGEVTVEGEVASEEVAAKVIDTVKATDGVTAVVNKLKVKSTSVNL